jgi:glutamate-ammonia-ligase adenylyltransferase
MLAMWPEFAAVAFRDLPKAEGNLARLHTRLPPELRGPLASLLAQNPDPDNALNLLERFVDKASPDLLREMVRFPAALTYVVATFGNSEWLAETFLADPDLAIQFARDRNFAKLKSKEDLLQDFARFAVTDPDPWLAAQLARFKRRNYLRIALKDWLGLSTLAETTLELSALADVILTNALTYCDQELAKRYGQPQYRGSDGRIARSGFSIISLGKLGGNELNYSSDIDLLFLYSHDGETSGGSERDSVISNKEYFVRLAHAIVRTITQTTPHGEVFRVDLRLRPEGDQGDLTISLRSALEYYARRAREWELQMLLKARHSAGDPKLTRDFLRGVERGIYSTPADFEAVESVLGSREKLAQRVQRSAARPAGWESPGSIDVKRHRGGIRDIEFLTQCLQRLHGGVDPWVRSGGTLLALRKLNDKGWISDRDYATLTSAYDLLRRLEHCVQLEHGRQTHRLPDTRDELERLAHRMRIQAPPGKRLSDVLLQQVQAAFAGVNEIYERVIHAHGARARSLSETGFELTAPLTPLPDRGLASFDSALACLEAQAPELASMIHGMEMNGRSRGDVGKFVASLLSSSDHFSLARENPERFRRALELIAASEYLAGLLIHHPEDIAALDAVPRYTASQADSGSGLEAGSELNAAANLFPAELFAPDADATDSVVDEPSLFPWVGQPRWSVREKMALLRREYRGRSLEAAAREISGPLAIFPALQRRSRLARTAIASALALAAETLDLTPAERVVRGNLPLVVLALGRLGLGEFDLASDADLVFVAEPKASPEQLDLCTRLAERTIDVLASYTRDGTVFAVDTRLRPRGREGELVVTQDSLLSYLRESAQAWEGLTYLKALPVAGDRALGSRLAASLQEVILARFAADPTLRDQLDAMRQRLEREMPAPATNMKTAPGGYYDVDFAVSYLRLAHHVKMMPGSHMLAQIRALNRAGILAEGDARLLAEGVLFLRSLDHAVRIVAGKPPAGLPERGPCAEAVEALAQRWRLLHPGESPASRLRQVQEGVRGVYCRLVAGRAGMAADALRA